MTTEDLEKRATLQARTFNPSILPFPTAVADWQTWVSDKGQWMFIEKQLTSVVANSLQLTKTEAFYWLGDRMLNWLTTKAAPKPNSTYRIKIDGREDPPVNFGVFQNQCFVFLPR